MTEIKETTAMQPEPFSLPEQRQWRLAARTATVLVPLLSLVVGLVYLRASWDDGAITAAFARTLALSGHMALTPVSRSVEGASSLVWTLALTPPAFLHAGMAAMLAWMKLCSALAFAGALLLFWRLAFRFLESVQLASLATLILAFVITPFHESFNGMEMNLSMLLVVGLTLVLTRERLGMPELLQASALTCALLATRFESPFLLFFLFLALALSPQRRRVVLGVAAAGVLCFVLMEFWRHATFGVWMPNTVYAKEWPPYQPEHDVFHIVANRLRAAREIPWVVAGPLLLTLACLLVFRSGWQRLWAETLRDTPLRLCALMAAAAVLFSFVLGHNWGHPGRMVEGYTPFVVLLIVQVAARLTAGNTVWQRRLSFAMVVTQVGFWAVLMLPKPPNFNVSVAELEREGELAEQVRERLHLEELHVLIPDVGGSALCCGQLDVHDSALLTNPEMSHTGYRTMPEYFTHLQPEIVVSRDPWSTLTKLYQQPEMGSYGVVGWHGMNAFVRPDLYKRLQATGLSPQRVSDTPGCRSVDMKPSDADLAYIERRGECLLLP